MITRLILSAFIGLLAATAPLSAQSNPSMNPDKESSAKKDPLGIGGFGKERPKGAKTEITAKKEATFDNAKSEAEFFGNVVVVDPQFKLFCDHLKVTLNKERKGLQMVEAMGNVIIVQENVDDSGKKTKAIGRAAKAVYEPVTGNVTLSGWPSVQHDINLQVATEEATIMILNRSGKMETKGGSKTVIVDTGEQPAN